MRTKSIAPTRRTGFLLAPPWNPAIAGYVSHVAWHVARHVVIPWTGTLSAARRAHEHARRWRRRSRWRAEIEGRIYSLGRDYGLARSRSHGEVGLERDVGWGVLASDLRQIAIAQAQRQASMTQWAA